VDRLEPEEAIEGKAGVMTKAELVDEVARVVHLTKKQAETIVNIVFDSIVEHLRSGQKKLPYSKPGKAKRGRIARADHSVKGAANSALGATPRPS